MSEWWTYTLGDFLLFSPRTYYRLLELYNLAIWPAQLGGLAIGFAVVALLASARPQRGRLAAGLLALCWAWIAWAFHAERYAQINWAASWFAAAFALQASLLVVLGVCANGVRLRTPRGGWRRLAPALIATVVVGYPLLAPLAGRAWSTAEVLGTAADPTAVVTVAAVALVRGPRRWLLLVVPLLWGAIAVATLWAMAAREVAILLAALLLLALLPDCVLRERAAGAGAAS
jgi:hypothetical protein